MMIASAGPIPPRSMAALKIRNFAQNPPVGGTPASEIMNPSTTWRRDPGSTDSRSGVMARLQTCPVTLSAK